MVSSITRTSGIAGGSASDVEGLGKGIESSFALNLIPLPVNPLFGTDGIRGRVGELLSAPLALQV
ncbi:MAG: phosphoglucosamine mutase, partial [Nostoc sp.]